jgi:hypothetical protein
VQAVGMSYRALRDIAAPDAGAGAFAYRTGQLVHESAVTGPDAWLNLGTDVEPVTGADVPAPARNAPAAAWESFLLATTDMTAEQVGAMGRDQMVKAYDKLTAPEPPARSGPAGQDSKKDEATS